MRRRLFKAFRFIARSAVGVRVHLTKMLACFVINRMADVRACSGRRHNMKLSGLYQVPEISNAATPISLFRRERFRGAGFIRNASF